MARPRLTDKHLPPRVYVHGRKVRYHAPTGKMIVLGTVDDLPEALRAYGALIQLDSGQADTVAWLIDWYLANVSPQKADLTLATNKKEAVKLKKELGHIPLASLESRHVGDYLDLGVSENRAIRANRERALLSHACTLAVRKGWMKVNPCRGVQRNPERKRPRYVEDAEMVVLWAACNVQTRALATLIYRTLQRPDDILGWTRANLITRSIDGVDRQVIKFTQSKTGRAMEIFVTAEIEAVFKELAQDKRKLTGMTLIHNRRGQRYTMSGVESMWTTARSKAAKKLASVVDVTLYDMKGKGATDMYRAGVQLSFISHLCGHESVNTTETYIKARLVVPVEPNRTKVG